MKEIKNYSTRYFGAMALSIALPGHIYRRDDVIEVDHARLLVVRCNSTTITVVKPTWWRMALRWMRRAWRTVRRK